MATYLTLDFADFGTDWTERFNTGGTWSESSGDVTFALPTSQPRGLSWNDLDGDANNDNAEILVLWTQNTGITNQSGIIFVRGSGTAEAANLYYCSCTTTSLRIYRRVAGSSTQVGTTAVTISAGTYYWFRFRVNGSATQLRYWEDGGSEPGTWHINTTDSAITGTGWAGLHRGTSDNSNQAIAKQFGFGSNGDTAPSSAPASAASLGFRPRFPHPILNF